MTPSTRTPTTKQGRVLFALSSLHDHSDIDYASTGRVTGFLAQYQEQIGSLAPVLTQRDVFDSLRAFDRHEWVFKQASLEVPHDNEGSNLAWQLSPAGRDALQRALQANTTKEKAVESTTQDPPVSEAPPWDGGAEPNQQGENNDEASLAELDEHTEEDGGEVEVEEPVETTYTTEGQQLTFTLKIGGAKPTSSILAILAKQVTFVDREFAKGDVLPFHGEIRVTEVGARDKKKGTERFHKAVVDSIVIGVDE
jgi:hypothetical protein